MSVVAIRESTIDFGRFEMVRESDWDTFKKAVIEWYEMVAKDEPAYVPLVTHDNLLHPDCSELYDVYYDMVRQTFIDDTNNDYPNDYELWTTQHFESFDDEWCGFFYHYDKYLQLDVEECLSILNMAYAYPTGFFEGSTQFHIKNSSVCEVW